MEGTNGNKIFEVADNGKSETCYKNFKERKQKFKIGIVWWLV